MSIAEIHDCFTITEAVIYEDLQFSSRGGAREDIEAGSFELTGELPINTDGGLKCFGHPMGATGLRMMYEVYHQMQGKPVASGKEARVGSDSIAWVVFREAASSAYSSPVLIKVKLNIY